MISNKVKNNSNIYERGFSMKNLTNKIIRNFKERKCKIRDSYLLINIYHDTRNKRKIPNMGKG